MTMDAAPGGRQGHSRQVVSKTEQARLTRRLIVETGIKCLARYGFANTTMLLISREAGISRGPMHYHFADRNELMSAIAEALPRGVSAALVKRLSKEVTLEGRLTAILDVALDEHLGAHHFAAMELLLAARNDAELSAAIGPFFRASELEIDEWWSEYLSMLRWPTERLVAFRHVTVACLRGLALDHLLQGEAAAHENALALFREMFMTFAKASVADA